ncbi:MAG: RNA methyltransferase [Candidatus Cloacimonadaceae bacterium]
MKYPALYSPEKFYNFSFDAQLKALHKLFIELEKDLPHPKRRQELQEHIRRLGRSCHEPLPLRYQKLLTSLSDDPHRTLRALSEYFGAESYKDSQISLRIGDGQKAADPAALQRASGITLVADNLRSVFNVGSLFRLSECLAIKELILCGITPNPSHPNMSKTALGTCERVPWRYCDSTLQAIMELKAKGTRIYALETAAPSCSVFEVKYSYPLALVLGNEALGIAPENLAICDEIVHLPVLGWKNSLNVSVAASISLYHILFGAKA